MLLKDKINFTYKELVENGPINIVVFGDSITHGALNGEYDYDTVYWNLLRKKINALRDYTPVNVINSGVAGTTATASVERLERDVLSHHPDLIIICFGLNDVIGALESYKKSLKTIFEKCKAQCEQVIFLTPNMLNTYVAEDISENLKDFAKTTAEYQNSGRVDIFIDSARAIAKECGVTVCDAYARWKEMYVNGEDTTKLLCNKINHPTKEMHNLFADMLFDIIMK